MSVLNKVVDGGYCIGCGACAVQDSAIAIADGIMGLPKAVLPSESEDAAAVCPFATSLSENSISDDIFSHAPHVDERIGHYIGTYAGHVSDEKQREKSSSGGMVTWMLLRLLARGDIDGVIHVGRGTHYGYQYLVSETAEDISKNSQSRYYPVHFEDALSSVLTNGRRYAFVGTPCYVKAVRLLCKENEKVRKSIAYCIAIFCGHMKSKSFSEMIALQQGIPLASLKYVDFRVKDRNALASRYDIQVHFTSENGVLASTRPIKSTKLHGMDWGLGYFKAPACDWCDDIAGETADFACGDAWLPEYVGDPLGTSVMIARNPTIEAILQAGRDDGSVALEAIGVSKIYESQAGNYRHRQEGLSVRIRDAQKKGIWFPNKRIKSNSFHVGIRRKVIYRFRKTLMNQSHISFNNAKSKRSYFIFMIKMLPLEVIYSILNQNFIKNSVKLSVIFCRYFRNRLSR